MCDEWKIIDERGSLTLRHHKGSDDEPETWLVELTENPTISGSLQAAGDWFELSCGDYKLNGSQVQTINHWIEEYL